MTALRKLVLAGAGIAAAAVLAASSAALLRTAMPSAAAASDGGGFAAAMRGRKLYVDNCARCHGQAAQGAPNWHVPDGEGRYPPPPLNGTAHTWHHPRAQLERIIAGGGITMPAFGEQLDEQQIADLVTYISSLWPDEIYEAWQGANQRSAASR